MKSIKSFLGLAALLPAIIALVLTGCQNDTVDPPPPAADTSISIKISPKTKIVGKGGYELFTATVTGTTPDTISWEILSNGSGVSATNIDENGVLSVAADESATYLLVTASYREDSSISDTATVIVTVTPPETPALPDTPDPDPAPPDTPATPVGETIGPLTVDELVAALAELESNTATTPHTVILDVIIDTSDTSPTGVWATINSTVRNARKYVTLDLSDCIATAIQGAAIPTNNHFNIIKNNAYIKGIVLPAQLNSIGASAFSGYTGLTSVNIPTSVTLIEDSAFSGCIGLTSMSIPPNVTNIGASAFSGCTGLRTVTISNAVITIGASAFSGCTGLIGVTIPEHVTTIGASAFSGCVNLISVIIPDTVTLIKASTFSGCIGLTSVSIPDNVTSIAEQAFSGCTSLTSVEIPDTVTSIAEKAFYRCTSLATVFIPDSVTYIGQSTFSGCSNLHQVTLSGNITSIEASTFSGCSSLASVTIPSAVTSIKDSAFSNCSDLNEVIFGETSAITTVWNNNAFSTGGTSTAAGTVLWTAYSDDSGGPDTYGPGTYRRDGASWTMHPSSP
jgi:hypothetical protein